MTLADQMRLTSGVENQAPKKPDLPFDGLFLEVIDQTLTDLLGARVREALWDYLARKMLLAKSDIPANADKLSTVLVGIFGKGSKTIERCVIKKLYTNLQREFVDPPIFNFQDEVGTVKILWEKQDHNALAQQSASP